MKEVPTWCWVNSHRPWPWPRHQLCRLHPSLRRRAGQKISRPLSTKIVARTRPASGFSIGDPNSAGKKVMARAMASDRVNPDSSARHRCAAPSIRPVKSGSDSRSKYPVPTNGRRASVTYVCRSSVVGSLKFSEGAVVDVVSGLLVEVEVAVARVVVRARVRGRVHSCSSSRSRCGGGACNGHQRCSYIHCEATHLPAPSAARSFLCAIPAWLEGFGMAHWASRQVLDHSPRLP